MTKNWEVIGAELIEGKRSCDLCGQHIKNVYHIHNRITGEKADVGCECVKKVISGLSFTEAGKLSKKHQKLLEKSGIKIYDIPF